VNQRFSSRTGWDLRESSFVKQIRSLRASGRSLLDLTTSNPTACGFHYDANIILDPLSDSRALSYEPDPRGMLSAREAIASYYRDHAATINPDFVNLTTSTSEGYSYLFRLLCDAGDEVLVPQPSYPLFDYLADLEDVRLNPYPVFQDYGWWIDFAMLEKSIRPHTRAILLVHPNNPTGHATWANERNRLLEICLRHDLALIVDEVFLDYPHGSEALQSFAAGPTPVLTFVLSGMSKVAGLPQMKVGWIVTQGPEGIRQGAIGRLEVIADTFLSMSAPTQLALPHWLSSRHEIQGQIRSRIQANLESLAQSGLERFASDGGWSAVLRLPRLSISGRTLLDNTGVIVHPGSFYGMAEPERIVVSLISQEDVFRDGISRIASAAK